jgi:hypothetical protein
MVLVRMGLPPSHMSFLLFSILSLDGREDKLLIGENNIVKRGESMLYFFGFLINKTLFIIDTY